MLGHTYEILHWDHLAFQQVLNLISEPWCPVSGNILVQHCLFTVIFHCNIWYWCILELQDSKVSGCALSLVMKLSYVAMSVADSTRSLRSMATWKLKDPNILSHVPHQLSLKYAFNTLALHLCLWARSSMPALKVTRYCDCHVLGSLHLCAFLNRRRSSWRASSFRLWWGEGFPPFLAFLGLLLPQQMSAWMMWNWHRHMFMSLQTKKLSISRLP